MFLSTDPLCKYFRSALLALTAWGLAFVASAQGGEDPIAQFEQQVRPTLEKRCFECHGPDKQKGGLRLDLKQSMLAGGDSGEPAIVPGNSAGSQLVKFVTSNDPDEKMPPKGDRLGPEQIAALTHWIDAGAHWPGAATAAGAVATQPLPADGLVITDRDRAFWSFQPPRHSEPVLAGDATWARQPMDRFILARLREKGLEPSPEASPAVFIRRVTFDLTGLPPTPEQADAFLSDTGPDAVERLVERLLGSPAFGERMASLWLPLARFAEDQALQVGDDSKLFYPNAWHYRAWVIDAFNRDLPYDRFLELQLAADSLPGTPPSDLPALGFLGLGPKYYNRGRLDVMADEWEDRVDTVTRTMLGLTVACARCHDHKFDPISTRDYYALAGIFASTRMVNKTPDGRVEKESKQEKVDPATLHIVEDGAVQDLNVFIRGNVDRKGPLVERRFLEVLQPAPAQPFKDGSGRRELAEAIANPRNPLTARVFVNRVWGAMFGRSLVSTPSNFGHSGAPPTNQPLLDDLAARFMDAGWSVKALVREIALSATYRQSSECSVLSAQSLVENAQPSTGSAQRPSAGSPPTKNSEPGTKHSFMEPRGIAVDPANELLWRMNRRRLTVEQWRDAVLAVSGELAASLGARSADADDPANCKRTLYSRISRLKLNDMLIQFDYPDANVHAEKRSVTTTALQKLFVLNSPFIQRRASALGARLLGGAEDDESRIALAYRLLFARAPDDTERALGLAYLQRGTVSNMSRWEQYAQVLLASNEMLYVD